jgi:Domain of unknown function (DUF6362)
MAALDTTAHMSSLAPASWSGDLVCGRMVEAYSILRRLPDRGRHRSVVSAWPAAVRHDFTDVLHWDDARERVWKSWERPQVASSIEISRMDEAMQWLNYLSVEQERRALQGWAAASANRLPLRKVLRQFNEAPSTFYRYRNLAAERIAGRLNYDGVTVR